MNKYWLVSLFEKLVYLRANKILVQTETIRKFFKGRLFSRTSVIFNPVNISEELVGRALTTPKRKRIVSVARLTSQKKHDMLIRAFARFNQTHPDYTLTIYGNGPQQKELQDLAVKLRVGDKVKMPGAIKAVHHEILNAEMFCLVSLREGMSNAMIEAMCLGLPCICTKVSGAIDLIEHNKNGILIDIDDENALYEQMCRLATDRQLSEKLGKEASRLYGVLRIDVISKQWTNYLNSLL
jgi:glycosyltransferase involved in cell wall biosynthesis